MFNKLKYGHRKPYWNPALSVLLAESFTLVNVEAQGVEEGGNIMLNVHRILAFFSNGWPGGLWGVCMNTGSRSSVMLLCNSY